MRIISISNYDHHKFHVCCSWAGFPWKTHLEIGVGQFKMSSLTLIPWKTLSFRAAGLITGDWSELIVWEWLELGGREDFPWSSSIFSLRFQHFSLHLKHFSLQSEHFSLQIKHFSLQSEHFPCSQSFLPNCAGVAAGWSRV